MTATENPKDANKAASPAAGAIAAGGLGTLLGAALLVLAWLGECPA